MKTRLLILLCLLSTIVVAQDAPAFKTLRYDEDYSALRSDSSRTAYQHLKYTPLSKNGNIYLSAGGEVRYQYFYVKNEDWGETPQDSDGYVLTRFLMHGDLHLGNHVRVFAQLQSSMSGGKQATSPVDENVLDLHQGFVDFKGHFDSLSAWTLRVGRQELAYGSQRLVSVRELPNNRQAFDAAKFILHRPHWDADLFYGDYVLARKGIMDDRFGEQTKLWGAYFVMHQLPLLHHLDLYYFGLDKAKAVYDDGQGHEQRHSAGARVWNNASQWRYDLEGLYQWGGLGANNISAWTASANLGYRFSQWQHRPELGLKAELISGNRQYGDQRLETFNPLFPKGAYFGYAALIGPSNLFDIHPSIDIDLNKHFLFELDYDRFWRMSANDGIYGPNVQMIYSGKGIASRDIGQQYSVTLTYTANRYFLVWANFTWFDAGTYLKNAGKGKDIYMAWLTAQFKF